VIIGRLNIKAPLAVNSLRVNTLKDVDLRHLEGNGISLRSETLPRTISPTFTGTILVQFIWSLRNLVEPLKF